MHIRRCMYMRVLQTHIRKICEYVCMHVYMHITYTSIHTYIYTHIYRPFVVYTPMNSQKQDTSTHTKTDIQKSNEYTPFRPWSWYPLVTNPPTLLHRRNLCMYVDAEGICRSGTWLITLQEWVWTNYICIHIYLYAYGMYTFDQVTAPVVLIEEPGPLGHNQFYDTTAFTLKGWVQTRLCVYVYMHVCMHLCAPYICAQIHYIHVFLSVYTFIHKYKYTCLFISLCVCAYCIYS